MTEVVIAAGRPDGWQPMAPGATVEASWQSSGGTRSAWMAVRRCRGRLADNGSGQVQQTVGIELGCFGL